MTTTPPLPRRLLAEMLRSAFLAAVVIGSGIAAQQLSPHATGLELFENAAAAAAGLFAIILMFGPVSGGHFNPVVSFVRRALRRDQPPRRARVPPRPDHRLRARRDRGERHVRKTLVSISTHHRASPAHLFSEIIATLGLLLVIFALARTHRSASAPAAVGAYIGAAYFFTSSTSFANPAISIGRIFSNTFAGIAPASVPGFVIAQVLGGAIAVLAIHALYPDVTAAEAATVVIAHEDDSQTETNPVNAAVLPQ